MADNWWDSASSSSRIRLESGGWPTDIVDIKASRSCLDSVSSVSGNSSINNLFQDNTVHKLPSSDPSLQMMGLGLSSQVSSLDWNQNLFRGDQNRESNFRPLIQEDHMSSSTTSFQQESGMSSSQDQWRSQYQQYGDHSSPIITCQGLRNNFQMDSYGSTSTMLQTLFGSENQQQQQQQSNYSNYPSSYGSMNNVSTDTNWLRNSPPKQLHLSNNAPFWNSTTAPMNDTRSNFFPPSNFEDKPPKNTSQVVKKNSSESTNKRPRNDNPSPLPAFKVRKEKMGDRITALQQLVSPFGKTDTASVLSEAIEYIKFLHEQLGVLSTPYMKNGAHVVQQQQIADKSSEAANKDLRSRGLCLVPVSSTFPVTHETTVDFWTPTFGGTFR